MFSATSEKGPFQIEVSGGVDAKMTLFSCTVLNCPDASDIEPPQGKSHDLGLVLAGLRRTIIIWEGTPRLVQGNTIYAVFKSPIIALAASVAMRKEQGTGVICLDTLGAGLGMDFDALPATISPRKNDYSDHISSENLIRSQKLVELALKLRVGCLATEPVLGQNALEPKLFPGMAPSQFSARLAGYISLSENRQMDALYEVYEGDAPDLGIYKTASRRMLTHAINLVLKAAYSDAFQVLLALQKTFGHRSQTDALCKYYISLCRRALEHP